MKKESKDKIYFFDIRGKLKGEGLLRELVNDLGIPKQTIVTSLSRGTLCRNEWYFSKSKEFTPSKGIFCFDIQGELILVAPLRIVSEYTGVTSNAIHLAIKRKSISDNKWFFSKTKNFAPAKKDLIVECTDKKGKLVFKGTVNQVCLEFNIPEQTVRSSINRGYLWNSKYYFKKAKEKSRWSLLSLFM